MPCKFESGTAKGGEITLRTDSIPSYSLYVASLVLLRRQMHTNIYLLCQIIELIADVLLIEAVFCSIFEALKS